MLCHGYSLALAHNIIWAVIAVLTDVIFQLAVLIVGAQEYRGFTSGFHLFAVVVQVIP